jgi:hypothetical protein
VMVFVHKDVTKDVTVHERPTPERQRPPLGWKDNLDSLPFALRGRRERQEIQCLAKPDDRDDTREVPDTLHDFLEPGHDPLLIRNMFSLRNERTCDSFC